MKVDLQPADLDMLILLAAAAKEMRERALKPAQEIYAQLAAAEALALRIVRDAMQQSPVVRAALGDPDPEASR